MITKIDLCDVASYRNTTSLTTDKKVNLIYGLNGAGKSTLSKFLYSPNQEEFTKCLLEGNSDCEITVYNQQFIHDYFYEYDSLKGIFTLSKENKQAEQQIAAASSIVAELASKQKVEEEKLNKAKQEKEVGKNDAESTLWEIKKTFAGGDRVLEYCLDGLKGQKDKLFQFACNLKKPDVKPDKTPDDLKHEIENLNSNNAGELKEIILVDLDLSAIETNTFWAKQIVGSENSSVSQLIRDLDNADWVKVGLQYIPEISDNEIAQCPFCQQRSLSKSLAETLQLYFDGEYKSNLSSLEALQTEYANSVNLIPDLLDLESNPYFKAYSAEIKLAREQLLKLLEENLNVIKTKINSPAQVANLKLSKPLVDSLNTQLNKLNSCILEHNKKVSQKDRSLAELKRTFWEIMRWDYDQTISAWEKLAKKLDDEIELATTEIQALQGQITKQHEIIQEQQRNTVNIDAAVSNINQALLELGIDCFEIRKVKDTHYRIVRGTDEKGEFHSLSEGEKTVITFLYFVELSKGKKDAAEISRKKIAVIDDPISSLSHIYVYEIGRVIKSEFIDSSLFEQVFVLTHSLYFFYELTDIKKERREANQKLFRIVKDSNGSRITDMAYEEIQNDYQAYWSVVNNPDQPPALIANCMRNIMEYFFNFVEKLGNLNNVFQSPELKGVKFQAFCRFMDRESHSLGQNIFDLKEFNYENFKEGLKRVFVHCGYSEHYKKMSRC